ncbi:MAG: hypothetical protein HQL66_13565 [Magnetococcales bacterium]|nr:hypothetical protein [Magnetococcales bacterium]
MRSWSERPREVAYLLNPGFCSLLLWSAASGYKKTDSDGLPFALSFLILPVVLHKSTREALPRSINSNFPEWIQKNDGVRLQFPERARVMSSITREGMLFGSQYGQFAIDSEGRIDPSPKPRSLAKYLKTATEEVRHCETRAEFLGRWFATAGDPATIMTLWGVRP